MDRLYFWVGTCETDYADDAWVLISVIAKICPSRLGQAAAAREQWLLGLSSKVLACGDYRGITTITLALRTSIATHTSHWFRGFFPPATTPAEAKSIEAICRVAVMGLLHQHEEAICTNTKHAFTKRASIAILVGFIHAIDRQVNASSSAGGDQMPLVLSAMRSVAKDADKLAKGKRASVPKFVRLIQALAATTARSPTAPAVEVEMCLSSRVGLLGLVMDVITTFAADCPSAQRRHITALVDAVFDLVRYIQMEQETEQEEDAAAEEEEEEEEEEPEEPEVRQPNSQGSLRTCD